MTDREKVIKGLEACSLAGTKEDCIGYGCPYLVYNDEVSDDCQEYMFDDALALLKAQEPRTETQGRWERVGSDGIVCCSECGMPMKKTRVCFPDGGSDYYYIATNYCPHCGAKNEKGDCDG